MDKARRITTSKSVSSDRFKLKIGTLDRRMPQVLFIEGSVYISPDDNMKPVNERFLKKRIMRRMMEENTFQNKFVIVFDAPKDRYCPNKWSYFSFQVFARQLEPLKYTTILDVPDSLARDVSDIIDDELEHSHFRRKTRS